MNELVEKDSRKGPGISLRATINAKCRECIYDPFASEGNWRQQVQACTSYNCPLYPVRPVSKPKKKEARSDVSGT